LGWVCFGYLNLKADLVMRIGRGLPAMSKVSFQKKMIRFSPFPAAGLWIFAGTGVCDR